MVGVVLLGHGHVASGLVTALEMVAGKQEACEVLDFIEADAATYGKHVEEVITSLAKRCGGIVVLCDVLGGTPFNCAMVVAAQLTRAEILTGVTLPMLIECIFNRGNTTLASLCAKVLSAGTTGIAHKSLRDELSVESASLSGSEEAGVISDVVGSDAQSTDRLNIASVDNACTEERDGI